MKKLYQNQTHCIGHAVSLIAAFLFLIAAAQNSRAASAFSLNATADQAALHAAQVLHSIQFYENLINKGKMLVIVPEPDSRALAALGGLIGLAAWRLRRRPLAKARN